MNAAEEDQWRSKLPVDVLMDILSRLPIKTLISFKCVCKRWLNLISADTHFVNLHHETAPTELLLRSSKRLSFGNLQFHNDSVSDLQIGHVFDLANFSARSDIKLPYPVIANSCNGFVCFTNTHVFNMLIDAVICNPVTGEFITVPGAQLGNIEESCFTYGLGFSGKENRYKLLRAGIRLHKAFAELHTFEKGSAWRKLADCPFSFTNSLFSWPLVYLQNKLHFHWRRRDMDRREYAYIDCFDFDTEQFGKVSLPPSYDYDRVYYAITGKIKLIGELESSLSISHFGTNSSVEVWVMKNYGVKDSWIKAFSLSTHVSGCLIEQSLRIPLMQLGNGDVLMYGKDDCLVLYNPFLDESRSLGCGSPSLGCGFDFLEVIAYNPTLLLLNDALAGYEACVQNLNSRHADLGVV